MVFLNLKVCFYYVILRMCLNFPNVAAKKRKHEESARVFHSNNLRSTLK